MSSRRQFIQSASFALLTSSMLRASAQPAPGARPISELLLKHFPAEGAEGTEGAAAPRPDKVIVIGAGVAGLAAAQILQDAGVPTVVLEGRDRLGGRAWTINLGGAGVDMNGGLLSDTRLAHLYDDSGWKYEPADMIGVNTTGFDAVTGKTGPADKELLARYLTDYRGPSEANEPKTLAEDYPFEQFAEKYFRENPIPGPDGRFIEMILRAGVDGSERSTFRRTGARPKTSHGYVAASFPQGGFAPFVSALGKGLDVRFSQNVTKIEQKGDRLRVSTPKKTYEGSHVLVTAPLGTLKAGLIEFAPVLPQAKLDAIANIGFSKQEKFAMLLDSPIKGWNSPNGPEARGSTQHIFYDSRTGCRITFQDLRPHLNKPIVKCSVHAAGYISEFVKLTPKEREDVVLKSLRAMAGSDLKVKKVVQTSWYDSPFSKGSWSFIKVHGTPELFLALGRPEYDGRLLFAGEATDRVRYSYVDGAVNSGVREARRLLGQAV